MAAKRAQCKKCGDINVAWVKSKRTGRYYLAYAYESRGYTVYGADSAHRVPGGGVQVSAHKPHKCDPAKAEKFQAEIAGYAAARGVTVEEWWQGK